MNTPKFSIIIPVYNVEKYLKECLNSIVNQTFKDLEIILINDGSTDRSLQICEKYAQKDDRIILINKEKNEGLGFARNTGLEYANCEYISFVDSDDFIATDTYEKIWNVIEKNDTDMIIFGLDLFYEENMHPIKSETDWYKLNYNKLNAVTPTLMNKINVEVWNKIYKKSIIDKYNLRFPKGIFEDVYFLYRYMAVIQNIYFENSILYFYRQRNNSLTDYCKDKKDNPRLLLGITTCEGLYKFYEENNILEKYMATLLDLLARNFWYAFDFLNNNLKKELFESTTNFLIRHNINIKKFKGKIKYYGLLLKLKNKEYKKIKQKQNILKRITSIVSAIHQKCFKKSALNHKKNKKISAKTKKIKTYAFKLENEKSIKLMISYHKPSTLLKDNILTPIHLGRALAKESSKDGCLDDRNLNWMMENMIGDDTGDNISDLNRKFCELTGIYWSWKNYDKLDNPDYIGFMHYCRHFVFYGADVHLFPYDTISKNYLNRINYSEKQIKNIINDYDFIAVNPFVPESSIYKQYGDNFFLKTKDLDIALNVLKEKYPEMTNIADEYMADNKGYFYNMFIMRKNLFFDYCQWIFDILFEVDKKIDYSNYTVLEYRVIGHLAERLTGIYFKYLMEKGNLRYSHLPVTKIKNTNLVNEIKPAYEENNIPIVFSSDDTYSPYLGVAVKSLIENSTKENNYDILIIDDKISDGNKIIISEMKQDRDNISIRFINIDPYLKNIDKSIFAINLHFALPTYYRFFIPTIFKNYNKIIYLDCDIIILKDLKDLYEIDLENNLLGAAIDLEGIRSYIYKSNILYVKKILKLKDLNKYFQAGILLLDIKKMIEENTQQKLINKLIEIKTPKFVDQCILNAVCHEQFKILSQNWNVSWHIPMCSAAYKQQLSMKNFEDYEEARKNPYIIHYCGGMKPWKEPQYELAHYFWKYAKMTPFYETILYQNLYSQKTPSSTKKTSKQIIFDFIKYDILSKITFGEMKRDFKRKRKELRKKLMK